MKNAVALLIAIAAAAWTVFIWCQIGPDVPMAMNTPTMGMDASLFLAVWIIMMIAMMFPTAVPMVAGFGSRQIWQKDRHEGRLLNVSFLSISARTGPSAVDAVDGSPPSLRMIVGPELEEICDGQRYDDWSGYCEVGVSSPRRGCGG